MTRFLLPILIASVVTAADHLPLLNTDGTFPQNSVWIEGGLGTTITDCDLLTVNLGTPATTRQLDGSWRPGVRGSIEVQNGWEDTDGFGLSLGYGIVVEHSEGRISYAATPGGPIDTSIGLNVDSVSFVLLPECVVRWDSDGLGSILPRDWMLEVGAIAGMGAAQARARGCAASDPGFAWQAGLRLRISSEIARNLRLGMSLGGVYETARVKWSDTGESSITSLGPIAAIALGWEF